MAPSKKPYGTLPLGSSGKIQPFEIHVDPQKVRDFKQLLKLSPVAKDCYENQEEQKGEEFGVTREWMLSAKAHWENSFDWYSNPIPATQVHKPGR